MKKLFLISIIGTMIPAITLAQGLNIQVPDYGYAYASAFTGNFSLLLSILIGAIAAFFVFRAAKRLGGGLFGSVLNYIAIGVSLIVLGTVSTVVNPWYTGLGFDIVSTVFFALGYVFTVIGANKLFKGIMSN